MTLKNKQLEKERRTKVPAFLSGNLVSGIDDRLLPVLVHLALFIVNLASKTLDRQISKP